jgi:hypothetical protein
VSDALRISGILRLEFRDRAEPVFDLDPSYVREAVDWCGHSGDVDDVLQRAGTTFVTMADALIEQNPNPLSDVDSVLLAYANPDLLRPEVAGCYLADRLPGSPIPFSVSGQGGGAAFTALGIAQGMVREGEARSGALFVIDQQVAGWDQEEPTAQPPDAAAMLTFGVEGPVAVTDLTDVRTGEPGDPTPAVALNAVLARHPGSAVVIGAGLAAALGEVPGGVEVADADALCTGMWALVAQRWPIREAVLLVDRQPDSGRVHSCVLEPRP